MSLRFLCPHCQFALSAPEDRAGAISSCPRCRNRVQVPTLTTSPVAIPFRPSHRPVLLAGLFGLLLGAGLGVSGTWLAFQPRVTAPSTSAKRRLEETNRVAYQKMLVLLQESRFWRKRMQPADIDRIVEFVAEARPSAMIWIDEEGEVSIFKTDGLSDHRIRLDRARYDADTPSKGAILLDLLERAEESAKRR